MVVPTVQPTLDEATTNTLLSIMTSDEDSTNRAQLQHRLNILGSWFGDLASISQALSTATILEIGPGQGDMTVPMAHFAHKIIAVDNAPLTYGSPFTLAQAQEKINASQIGPRIQWVQSEIVDYLQTATEFPDYIVLAHSVFYMTSEEYFIELLNGATRLATAGKAHGKNTKILIAEWGMRASSPAGEAHILAAKAQATNPNTDGNVRTIITPARLQELGEKDGWVLEGEKWMESPELEDGMWDVDLAKTMAYEEKVIPVGEELKAMERAVEGLGEEGVRCMDAWTGTFGLRG